MNGQTMLINEVPLKLRLESQVTNGTKERTNRYKISVIASFCFYDRIVLGYLLEEKIKLGIGRHWDLGLQTPIALSLSLYPP